MAVASWVLLLAASALIKPGWKKEGGGKGRDCVMQLALKSRQDVAIQVPYPLLVLCCCFKDLLMCTMPAT